MPRANPLASHAQSRHERTTWENLFTVGPFGSYTARNLLNDIARAVLSRRKVKLAEVRLSGIPSSLRVFCWFVLIAGWLLAGSVGRAETSGRSNSSIEQ